MNIVVDVIMFLTGKVKCVGYESLGMRIEQMIVSGVITPMYWTCAQWKVKI